MYKRLIVSIIFVLSAMGLSAQGLVLSADINSGLWAHWNNKEDGDTFLQVAGSDAVPVRINFRGQYDNAAKNLGFSFNLRGQARNTDTPNDKPRMDPNWNNTLTDILFFEKAIAYLKMFNGKLTFTAGYWDPELWETPGGISSDMGMVGAGLIMDVEPLSGLNLMASGWAKESDTTLLREAKYIITGRYVLPEMFRVVTHFAFHQYGWPGFSKDDDNTNHYMPDGTSSYDELADKDQQFGIGVGYLGLTSAGFSRLGIDTKVHNLGGAKSPSWDGTKMITVTPFFLGQRITWSRNDLELDGRFYQRFNLGDDRYNYGPSLRFRVTALYAFKDTPIACDIVPKLGFNMFINSNAWGDNPVDMRFDEGVLDWEECTRERGGWGICPAVEFRFDGLAHGLLELGYSLKVNTGKPDPTVPITEKSTINHAAYVFVKIGMGRE